MLTLDAEREGTIDGAPGFAVGGAETVDMSRGSLTGLAESGGSINAKSLRIGAGEVPVTVMDEGGELASDENDADDGGTEVVEG